MMPDVVVIGGGIVGSACAYYLSKAGVKVCLIDKGSIGSGASKAGMCHIVTGDEPDIYTRFGKIGVELYAELSRELPIDIQFRRTGSILVEETSKNYAAAETRIQHLHGLGIRCSLLDGKELQKMEPNIAPDIAGALYFDDDAQINPLYATQALASGAKRQGAEILPFLKVTGFALNAQTRRIEAVVTADERIPTKYVVNATGAYAGFIGSMLGLDFPITPRKGHLAVTVPIPEDLIRNKIVVLDGYQERTFGDTQALIGAVLQQTKNGNLLLGASRQLVGFDVSVDPYVVSMQVNRCVRIFPILKNVTAIRLWAGLRPYTADGLPMIGPVDAIPNFLMAAGHDHLGITGAPLTGKLIAQMITGQALEIPLAELKPDRFTSRNGSI